MSTLITVYQSQEPHGVDFGLYHNRQECPNSPQVALGRIKVPNHIDLEYQNLKSTLVYLETPECRGSLTDTVRLAEIKEYTQQFRALLIVRNHLNQNNGV